MDINKFIFQTKDYQLVFVAYNAKHAELRRKSKDWLLRNQDIVSEWSDMYIHGLNDCFLTPTQQFYSYIMARPS
jgi:hypothetical protein